MLRPTVPCLPSLQRCIHQCYNATTCNVVLLAVATTFNTVSLVVIATCYAASSAATPRDITSLANANYVLLMTSYWHIANVVLLSTSHWCHYPHPSDITIGRQFHFVWHSLLFHSMTVSFDDNFVPSNISFVPSNISSILFDGNFIPLDSIIILFYSIAISYFSKLYVVLEIYS